MEVGLYLPVYSRSFRGGNTIFSPWRLSRFVTKLFKCNNMYHVYWPERDVSKSCDGLIDMTSSHVMVGMINYMITVWSLRLMRVN